MNSIFAQKKAAGKAVISPFEFSMLERGRIKLEFGKGMFRRQVYVTHEQKKQIDEAFRAKIPMSPEQLVFDVLRENGKKQAQR